MYLYLRLHRLLHMGARRSQRRRTSSCLDTPRRSKRLAPHHLRLTRPPLQAPRNRKRRCRLPSQPVLAVLPVEPSPLLRSPLRKSHEPESVAIRCRSTLRQHSTLRRHLLPRQSYRPIPPLPWDSHQASFPGQRHRFRPHLRATSPAMGLLQVSQPPLPPRRSRHRRSRRHHHHKLRLRVSLRSFLPPVSPPCSRQRRRAYLCPWSHHIRLRWATPPYRKTLNYRPWVQLRC